MTEFVIFKMFKNIHIQEEKTMAKKILAILLALSLVFAFAACGGNEEATTTTAPVETTEDPFAAVEETEAEEVTEDAEGFAKGVTTDDGWESKWLGIRYTAPAGTAMTSEEDLNAMKTNFFTTTYSLLRSALF